MLKTTEEFQAIFNLDSLPEYYDPTILNDTAFGFSVKRKYPKNFAYQATADHDGLVNDFAVIWVVLRESLPTKNGSYPVTIRVSNIRSYSSEESKKTRKSRPLELQYNQDFFFNPVKKIFVDDNGKNISAKSMIDLAYREHCDTIHPIRGLELRLKEGIKATIASMLLSWILIFKFFLESIFKVKLENVDNWQKFLPLSSNFYGFKRVETKNLKESEKEKFEIFGYKGGSKETIVIFAAIVALLWLGRYYKLIHSEYFEEVIKDNFLTLVHAILMLSAIDFFPHRVLLPSMNWLMRVRGSVLLFPINPFSYKKWSRQLALTALYAAAISIIIKISARLILV